MRALPLALLVASGCGGYVTTSAHDAAVSALDVVTSPDASARYAGMAAAAASSARTAALDAETERRTAAVVSAAGTAARSELVGARDALLDAQGRREVAALREALLGDLRGEAVGVVNAALGEATRAGVASLREELVGAPLRADIDALIDEAAPHLAKAVQASVAPVQADAEKDAVKFRDVAITLGVAIAVLVAAFWALAWRHRKLVAAVRAGTAKV